MKIYQCEDSLEGIFTAIYNAYEDRAKPEETMIGLPEELFLFAEYIPVQTDTDKAWKVINTLKRRFGEEDYFWICLALASYDTEKANAVYHTVVYGLSHMVSMGHLFDNLANQYLHKVFSLGRASNNEYLHLRGFLRFQELEGKILYAGMGPKNHLITFLMPHFADRFPTENFMIHDDTRGIWGIHPAGKDWFLARESDLGEDWFSASKSHMGESWQQKETKEEEMYRELFCHFCHTIAIKERYNPKLQQSMLPLHFREYMVEFANRA